MIDNASRVYWAYFHIGLVGVGVIEPGDPPTFMVCPDHHTDAVDTILKFRHVISMERRIEW